MSTQYSETVEKLTLHVSEVEEIRPDPSRQGALVVVVRNLNMERLTMDLLGMKRDLLQTHGNGPKIDRGIQATQTTSEGTIGAHDGADVQF